MRLDPLPNKFLRVLCGANALGAVAYLFLGSRVWIEPELADVPGVAAGDSLIWGLTALPIFLIFLTTDLLLLLRGLAVAVSNRRLGVRGWCLPIPLLWLAVLYVDFQHHGRL